METMGPAIIICLVMLVLLYVILRRVHRVNTDNVRWLTHPKDYGDWMEDYDKPIYIRGPVEAVERKKTEDGDMDVVIVDGYVMHTYSYEAEFPRGTTPAAIGDIVRVYVRRDGEIVMMEVYDGDESKGYAYHNDYEPKRVVREIEMVS